MFKRILFPITLFSALISGTPLEKTSEQHPVLPTRQQAVFSAEVLKLISDIEKTGIAQIVKLPENERNVEDVVMKTGKDSPYLPVVQMHGMGDFADNPMGMIPLKNAISKELNETYVKNVALGSSIPTDMMGSFIETMGREVDIFAEAVQKDENLANGFNAVGYSQGNLIIRGFIEKYNNPPVKNWVSIHGPLVGVAGFPQCNFTSEICQLFDNFLGEAAYQSLSQHVLAQANYYRDPLRIPQYLSGNLWLPGLNNENSNNVSYTTNFNNLTRLVCVKALEDTMIWPNESEWWGFYEDGSDKNLLKMEDTNWYKNDLFGLKSLVESNRYYTFTTPGNHLQFNTSFLLGLVDQFFK